MESLHPEFAFLPRKFKLAVTGAAEDRAAIAWHDVGLQLLKNDAGDVGFTVLVGGGMGRTPVIGSVINAFVPWQEILVYLEAIVRVYNRFGRRGHAYKARIKILVKAEGQKFFDAVNAEFVKILEQDVDGREHIIPASELERVARHFQDPAGLRPATTGFDPNRTGPAPAAFLRWRSAMCTRTACRATAPSRCRSSAPARRRATPQPTRWTPQPRWPTATSWVNCG